MTRRTRDSGSALLTVVILVMVMTALAASYAYVSVQMEHANLVESNRYQARLAAMSGMTRALAELQDSIGTNGCTHKTSGQTAYSCYGNIDGNMNDTRCSVASAVQNKCTSSWPNSGTPTLGAADTYGLDSKSVTADGFIDFKGETSAAAAGVAISKSDPDGSYTVRLKPEQGVSQGYNLVYRVRSYGVYKREAAGLEAIFSGVLIPFQPFGLYGAYAKFNMSQQSSATADSYKTGYPPAPNTSYTGFNGYPSSPSTQGNIGIAGSFTPSGNPFTVQGSVMGSTNADFIVSGTSASGATNTLSGGPPNPPPAPPVPPLPGGLTSVGTLSGSVAQTSGNILAANLGGSVTFSPAAGQTLYVWVSGNSSNVLNITINQPAGWNASPPTAQPGMVVVYLMGNSQIVNGSSTTWNNNGLPAALQIYGSGTNLIQFQSSATVFAAISLLPSGTVDMQSQASVFGAVNSSQINMQSSGNIHYDLSLQNLTFGVSAAPVLRVYSLVDVAPRTD